METIFDANDLRRPGYYKWYTPVFKDKYKSFSDRRTDFFDK